MHNAAVRSHRLRWGLIQCGIIAAALVTPVAVLAGAGELDPSFDGDGKATLTIGEIDLYTYPTPYLSDMVLQPDGKIVVAGRSLSAGNTDFALARFTSDGSVDTSFDGDGKVITAIGSENDGAHGVALQSDGKIVVSGYTHSGTDQFFALARYNADGSLDTSFDGDGKVVTSFPDPTQAAMATRVAIQSDGKIVVTGDSYMPLTRSLTVVRYNTDGSLDTAFDGDGIVQTVVGENSIGNDLVLQVDGKIVVVGTSTNFYPYTDAIVVRYNADGSLDTAFDGDGIAIASLGDSDTGYGVTLQPDGKIVASGFSHDGINYGLTVLRYNSDGTPDTSFSGDGVVIATESNFPATDVVIQADGTIAVGGYDNELWSDGITIVRLKRDGTLDETFWSSGSQGKLFNYIGLYGNRMFALASQPDNRLVLAGYGSSDGTTQDFAVARALGGAPCGPVSVGCLTSVKAKLGIKNDNANASSDKDKLQWKWNGGPELTQADFADPTGSTRYSFCLYQGATNALFATAAVDPGSGWAVSGTKGYKFKGLNADGLTNVGLKGGAAGKSKVLLKGKGVRLPDFVFGALEYPVTVQLKKQGSSLCFESTFTAAHGVKNDFIQFKAKY